jgi:hypothetical protein
VKVLAHTDMILLCFCHPSYDRQIFWHSIACSGLVAECCDMFCEDCKFISHSRFPLETECRHWAHHFYLSKNYSMYKGTVNSYILCECSVTFE